MAASILQTLDPANHATVYETYDSLRAVARDPELNAWLLTDHASVVEAAADTRLSSVRYRDLDELPPSMQTIARVLRDQIFYLDAPDHTRIRSLMTKAFSARSLAGLRAQIEQTADRMIDDLVSRDGVDVIADIAYPLPVSVICDLLNVPAPMRASIKHWSAGVAAVMGKAQPSDDDLQAGADGVAALIDYLTELLVEQRKEPTSAVFESMVHGDVTDEEILANAAALLLVGHETTTNLIANGMLALLQHPSQRDLLAAEPDLLKPAIEEMLRFDPSVQNLLRRATEDVSINGVEVAAGETVLLVVGAANRDPAAFPDPHVFDIRRTGPRHVAFGHGPHFCIGAGLARLEAEIVLPRLLDRLSDFELAGESLEWHSSLTFRGLKRLPLTRRRRTV